MSDPAKPTPPDSGHDHAAPPAPTPVADQFKNLEAPFAAADGTIPLAPDLDPPAPMPIAGSSLLTPQDDLCPNCRAHMSPDAVVCMKCGYDQKQGRVVRPELGTVEVEDPKSVPEYVTTGRGPSKVVAIAAAVVLVGAMIVAGIYAPVRTVPIVAALLGLMLFQTILYTGTGVFAVWAAARLVSQRFTNIDLVAARMFFAVALFQLISHLVLFPEPRWLSQIVVFVLAVGAYWLTIFFFFRKNHKDTSVLLALHVAASLFVQFGVLISAFLQTVVASK